MWNAVLSLADKGSAEDNRGSYRCRRKSENEEGNKQR